MEKSITENIHSSMHTERETDRQTDRPTDRQRQREKERERLKCKHFVYVFTTPKHTQFTYALNPLSPGF